MNRKLKLRIKRCIVKRKICRLSNEIRLYRNLLINRNNTYHGGRLNIDHLVDDFSKERLLRIRRMKRYLVKIKIT